MYQLVQYKPDEQTLYTRSVFKTYANKDVARNFADLKNAMSENDLWTVEQDGIPIYPNVWPSDYFQGK